MKKNQKQSQIERTRKLASLTVIDDGALKQATAGLGGVVRARMEMQ